MEFKTTNIMTEQFSYWMALAHMERIWTKRKNEIVVAAFNRGNTIADFFMCDEKVWVEDYHLTQEEKELFLEAKSKLPNYSFMAEDLLEQGYSLLPITSEEYPKSLKVNLKYNAPVLLYAKGSIKLLQQDSIAIVGSRSAKPISLQFTDNVAHQATLQRKVVVSGFAKGVDKQALDSTLQYGGDSIVVLPQGITTFSSGFRSLYKPISSGKVVVISTFAPTAPWSVAFAMARNPIIYGLAQDIYVAESDSKGGTYSGVEDGLRKKRQIFVRYPKATEKNANALLIKMGATAVDMTGNIIDSTKATENTIEQKIILLIKGHPMTAKEIAERLLSSVDRKAQSQIRSTIKTIKDVRQTSSSPIKYIIESHTVIQPELF